MDTNKVNEHLDETPESYREFEEETKLKPDVRYFSEWRHIDLLLDRAASSLTMCVDGEVVFSAVKLHGDLARDSPDGACEFRLIYFAKPGIKWDGYYKNLKLVRQPG